MSIGNCPECNASDFKMREKPTALIYWEKINEEPVLDVHDFIPVRAHICQNCGFR
ncbi:hypothetical protein [Paenibacillus sp. FSL L8-0506]|uniref:hypothetical protein n=1 Tax=Paenibacillus sp. FSL L8-0506 TaxID=2975335 RepID=UPI0030FC6394